MNIRETKAKSILRKHKKIDSWFISHYGMNLYRGCIHNCAYCDGRAEGYYVEGEFGNDIEVKVNAPEILDRELDPKRKRKPLKQSFLMIGGGVGDSYQKADNTYMLTRKALDLAYKYNFPVHVLTKSTDVIRDLDILKKINEKTKAIVSFSISSVDDSISAIFEPHVPSPHERLETMALLKSHGITCGIFLMPVIPFITDLPNQMENSIRCASQKGADFIIFSGMTLKEGRQKTYFMNRLKTHFPDLFIEYNVIYKGGKWGQASKEYYNQIHYLFNAIMRKYKIPKRIPPALFRNILSENDLVVVLLEHLDYFLKIQGHSSPYGYAAYSVSQVTIPLSELRGDLNKLKGVGKTTERIILEILDTGRSTFYEKLAG